MFIVNEIIDDLKFAYDLVDNLGDFIPDTERTTTHSQLPSQSV